MRTVEVSGLCGDRFQYRSAESVESLAQAIEASGGLLNAIQVVRERDALGKEFWVIVSGHRRVAAYKLLRDRATTAEGKAQWSCIPAIDRTGIDRMAMSLLALMDNLQRCDSSDLETGRALSRLQEEYGCSGRELASRLGLSEDRVKRLIRLASAPPEIQAAVQDRRLGTVAALRLISMFNRLAEQDGEMAAVKLTALLSKSTGTRLRVRAVTTLAEGIESEPSHPADLAQAAPVKPSMPVARGEPHQRSPAAELETTPAAGGAEVDGSGQCCPATGPEMEPALVVEELDEPGQRCPAAESEMVPAFVVEEVDGSGQCCPATGPEMEPALVVEELDEPGQRCPAAESEMVPAFVVEEVDGPGQRCSATEPEMEPAVVAEEVDGPRQSCAGNSFVRATDREVVIDLAGLRSAGEEHRREVVRVILELLAPMGAGDSHRSLPVRPELSGREPEHR